jgi:hypothetical protein
MSVEQAAEKLDLTPQRVRQFCREGRLGRRVGKTWVITDAELEAFAKIPRLRGISINRPKKR